jgi:hypothetical protein
MRMSCGQSDGEPTNQGRKVLRNLASSHHSATAAIYYNRLEYNVRFRRFCAGVRSSACSPLAAANSPSRDAVAARTQIPASRAFLSLPQVRESCHKQLRGVTAFRRGIA